MPRFPLRPSRTLALLALRFALGFAVLALPYAAGCDAADPDDDLGPPPPAAALPIASTVQQQEVWCWAATVEMVLRHYGAPNISADGDYQCGVVSAYAVLAYGADHPCASDCDRCVQEIGGMGEVERLVEGYGRVARGAGLQSPVLEATAVPRALALDELMREVGAGRPVIAAVGSGGVAGGNDHVVVLVGYDTEGAAPTVTVNDPFPYERHVPPSANPYLLAGGVNVGPGQYTLPLASFKERFAWGASLYRIRPD